VGLGEEPAAARKHALPDI